MAVAQARAQQKKLLPATFENGLKRALNKLFGLSLLLVSAFGWGCLMTWSIQDPSLNLAIDGPVQNLLGVYGAALADLLFQTFGLAAIFVFLPVAIWGFHFCLNNPVSLWHLRITAWPISIALIALTLSFLPKAATWPLPQSYGGIIGDTLYTQLNLAPLAKISLLYWLTIIGICIALSIIVLFFTCALRLRDTALLFHFENPDQIKAALLSPINRMSYRMRQNKAIAPKYRGNNQRLWWRNASVDDAPPHPGKSSSRAKVYPDVGDNIAHQPMGAPHRPHYNQTPSNNENPLPPMSAKAHRRANQMPLRGKQNHAKTNGSADYELPYVELLNTPVEQPTPAHTNDELLQMASMLENVLLDFGVKGQVLQVHPGPVITLFEFEPARGTKTSRIVGLADDIARSMQAFSARIAVIPGRNVIGIELPNEFAETVFLRELVEQPEFYHSECALPLILGRSIGGEPIIVDLATMPHLLIAGTTGSGKSVGINTMLLSLLYRLTPEQCRMILIDPKMLELSIYDGIPHLLTPVVTDPGKAVSALKWAVREMEDRYRQMSKLGVRNIESFNQRINETKATGDPLKRTVQTGFDQSTGRAIFEEEDLDFEPLPLIVIVIDEMADLMMVAGKEIEATVQRLAQMARAAGIHVIMATQRPSVDVITGTIKANFPTRISFQVTSKIDSRTILGKEGAEQLLGRGDMLYMPGGSRVMRVHGAFVDDDEVENVANHLRNQSIPEYLDSVIANDENLEADSRSIGGTNKDDLFEEAISIVLRDQKASISYLQRRLSIGYNKAATLIERMEEEGIISAAGRNGKREILIDEPH